MTLSSILEERLKFFAEKNPSAIFRLYHKDSKFREFFATEEEYISQFDKLVEENTPINVEVFRECQCGDMAEALYIEIFKCGDTVKKFYSKSKFIMDNGKWLIIEEKREEQYIKD